MQIAKHVTRAVGILLIIFGIVLVIIGSSMNSDFYVQVEYYYAHGMTDRSGYTIMYYGIGLVAAGIITIIISLILSVKIRHQYAEKTNDQNYGEFDDMVAQLSGNRSIFDVFHSEDRSRIYSFYRNKRPILWRITMDRDGKQESYEVSKVEGNILVKNDEGEEIFYRG